MEHETLTKSENLDLWECPYCHYCNPLIDIVCEFCQNTTEENYLHINVPENNDKNNENIEIVLQEVEDTEIDKTTDNTEKGPLDEGLENDTNIFNDTPGPSRTTDK